MEYRKNTRGGEKTWRFFRAGGFDQVRISTGHDLLSIDKLDRKLWAALACPVSTINFDRQTLSFIDSDGDGRIRAEELIAAVKWITPLLKNPDILLVSADGLAADAINDQTAEGRQLLATFTGILTTIARPADATLAVNDINQIETIFRQHQFNGDGVITVDTCDSPELRQAVQEIIATCGQAEDRCGKPGITADIVNGFFSDASGYITWYGESETQKEILCIGNATFKAAEAYRAVQPKIDDYFIRCKVARFSTTPALTSVISEKLKSVYDAALLSDSDQTCEALPLFSVCDDGGFSFDNPCNPAWSQRLETFRSLVVEPFFGNRTTLSFSEWKDLGSRLAAYFAWETRRPDSKAARLGVERLRELLSGTVRSSIESLIRKDAGEAAAFNAITDVEKLIRLKRDLYRLCSNFINFSEFYSGRTTSIFQTGTLYIDQRCCHLCITVEDVSKHSTMAAMASTCIVYCECRRRGGTERQHIAAVITDGDSENLMVGRNGVFYDADNRDWDATIVKIIDNPISLKQAFWLPYKNLVRMIEEQVAKRASAADAASAATLENAASRAATLDKKVPEAPPRKIDTGTVAALGVAAGALGTFFATLMGYATGIVRMGPMAMAGAAFGVLMLISGPSLILAYIKLRKRNLGPLLDANGWAVNARARLSVRFGTILTQCAVLPPGSRRDLTDPYADKKRFYPRLLIACTVIVCAWLLFRHYGGEAYAGFIRNVKELIGTTGVLRH